MKRVLITGITGFVGTNLVRYLQNNSEIQIIGYSQNINKAKSLLSNVDFISEISANILDRYLIDTVIHLAGIAHDLSGNFNDEDYQRVNFRWTCEIYDEFLRSQVSNFIFISSIKAVTDHAHDLIDEKYISNPRSDYGVSKKNAEEYMLNNQKFNKNAFILRPCMIHGPGNKGNLNLLYKVVKAGIPYPLGAFKNKRSFLSIENFCFTIVKILESKLSAGIYLLADNDAISTNDLIRLIGQEINKKVIIVKIPKDIVKKLALFGTWFHTPFNLKTVAKLSENMVVSNQKLLLNLDESLPESTIEGLRKTIKSFHE